MIEPAAASAVSRRPWQEILLNRKMLICIFQGFISGLPYYVLFQLVPGWLRREGIDLATIGLFNLVTIFYVWKFAWSPLLDRFRLPFLGRRRGWMLASQILLLAGISQFGSIDPAEDLRLVVFLVLATSFFGATQDIVLDAYRREMLQEDELGTGNSIFVNAYRLSSLAAVSLAFVLADQVPWSVVFWTVSLFMTVGIVTTALIPETADDAVAPKTLREAVVDPFVEFFTRDSVRSGVAILLFMLLYKLGDNMTTALQTPFYVDMGFTNTEIGLVGKFAGLGGAILGSALGGVLMLKLSINRALWIFGFVQLLSIFGFAALAKAGNNLYMLFTAAGFEYVGVGLGTVALTAFIARSTSTRFTATQLALLTSFTAVPRTFANSATGFIIEAVGYFNFFLICAAIAVPGMLMLFVVAPWSEPDRAVSPSVRSR